MGREKRKPAQPPLSNLYRVDTTAWTSMPQKPSPVPSGLEQEHWNYDWSKFVTTKNGKIPIVKSSSDDADDQIKTALPSLLEMTKLGNISQTRSPIKTPSSLNVPQHSKLRRQRKESEQQDRTTAIECGDEPAKKRKRASEAEVQDSYASAESADEEKEINSLTEDGPGLSKRHRKSSTGSPSPRRSFLQPTTTTFASKRNGKSVRGEPRPANSTDATGGRNRKRVENEKHIRTLEDEIESIVRASQNDPNPSIRQTRSQELLNIGPSLTTKTPRPTDTSIVNSFLNRSKSAPKAKTHNLDTRANIVLDIDAEGDTVMTSSNDISDKYHGKSHWNKRGPLSQDDGEAEMFWPPAAEGKTNDPGPKNWRLDDGCPSPKTREKVEELGSVFDADADAEKEMLTVETVHKECDKTFLTTTYDPQNDWAPEGDFGPH